MTVKYKYYNAAPPAIKIKEPVSLVARLKYRHIFAAGMILLSIAVKPFFIEHAYMERGYSAYGGEYIVIPFGIVLASIILMTASIFDEAGRAQHGIQM